MKKTFLLALIFFGVFSISQAQTHLSLGGQVIVPMAEFKDNTDAIGGGFNAGLYFPFAPRVPVYFGLNFGYSVYGSNTQRLDDKIDVKVGQQVIDQIDINLKTTTNNNLLNGFAVLRFKAPLPMVQPYIDGVAGFNYLYTRTKIIDETPNRIFTSNNNNNQNSTNNVISASTQSNSFVFAYGGAAGIMIKLGAISLDIRGLYLKGGEAEYYDRSQTQTWEIQFSGAGSFDDQNPTDISLTDQNATPKKSTTDMLQINFGLVFNL